jgi:hypothetical protein
MNTSRLKSVVEEPKAEAARNESEEPNPLPELGHLQTAIARLRAKRDPTHASERPPSAPSPEGKTSQGPASTDRAVTAAPPGASSGHQPVQQRGFSTRYEKASSLVEWLSLLEFVEGDALVSIASADGKFGFMWCSAGQIVDASCDELGGEEAFFRIVESESGEAAVAFTKVQHPRVIATTTKELLQRAATHRKERASTARTSAPAEGPVPVLSGLRPRADHAGAEPSLANEAVRQTVVPSAPRPAAQRIRIRHYFAAFAVGMGVVSLVLWVISGRKWLKSAPRETSQAESLNAPPGEPAPEPKLLMDIDVEPVSAEIWLDDRRVGRGHFRRPWARDGREHEIRLVAPGYVAQSILFRDTSPVLRVMLEQVAANPSAKAARLPDRASPTPDAPADVPSKDEQHPHPRPKRPVSPAPATPRRPLDAVPEEPNRAVEVPEPSKSSAPVTAPSIPRVQVID